MGRGKRETLGRKEKFGSESFGKEEGRAKGHIGIASALPSCGDCHLTFLAAS